MIAFENYPEIGEKIFSYLDLKTLLKIPIVCQDWKQVLENPYFWLKKLTGIGHPSEIDIAWKLLITKAADFGVTKSIFTKSIKMKFKDLILAEENFPEVAHRVSVHHLECPPLYAAAQSGSLEVVKLIYEMGEENSEPFTFEKPIFAAISNGHTEVAKFLADDPQEKQKSSVSFEGYIPIHLAIKMKNLDLVKFLAPRTPHVSGRRNTKYGYTLLHTAICDFRIFSFVMSLPGIEPNFATFSDSTPLKFLCNNSYTSRLKIPTEDVIKMIRILAPLADNKQFYLHFAAEHGSVEVLKTLLEIFDTNVCNLPFAIKENQIEDVKILELKMRDFQNFKQSTSDAMINEMFGR